MAATVFTGCEGYRCGDGQVLDRATNLPLDSVFVEAITGRQTMYTDSTGNFEVCNTISGCLPDCLDITVRFSKPGYATITVTNPEKATIYLQR